MRYDDIDRLGALIRNTLLISNSLDYDMTVIQNLSRQYSTRNVREMAMRRRMYVHLSNGVVDGTVSVKGDTIYAFLSHLTGRETVLAPGSCNLRRTW